MTLSITIIGILLLGLQSAILLAAKAAPDRSSGFTTAIKAAQALDQFQLDLSAATGVSSGSATSVSFTVPDRTGDNSPETITYSWSGTAGDSLYRTINSGTAVAVASNVRHFALTYNKKTKTRATTYTESGEVLLASNDGLGLLNLGNFNIDNNDWCGQYFKPTLPAGATSWRVTRIKFQAMKHGAAVGRTRVQVRSAASNGLPMTVLDESTLDESTLGSSYAWQEYTFSNAGGISPSSGACMTFQWVSDADACYIEYQALLGLLPNSWLVKTANAGTTWTIPTLQSMVFYAYGTYNTANASSSDTWLTSVGCNLRLGTDAIGKVVTTVRLPNEPQVTW